MVSLVIIFIGVITLCSVVDSFRMTGKHTVLHRWRRLPASLQIVNIVVDLPSSNLNIEERLYSKVPESQVVRWYVVGMNQTSATIEAVVEPRGVGKSGIYLLK